MRHAHTIYIKVIILFTSIYASKLVNVKIIWPQGNHLRQHCLLLYPKCRIISNPDLFSLAFGVWRLFRCAQYGFPGRCYCLRYVQIARILGNTLQHIVCADLQSNPQIIGIVASFGKPPFISKSYAKGKAIQ